MPDAASSAIRDRLARWMVTNDVSVVCDLELSHGSYLHDTERGVDHLDMLGFHASLPLGYNHPGLAQPGFTERLGRIARHKPANAVVHTAELASFVDKFCHVVLAGEMPHAFFVEGGSPAVENAVKAAIDWKHRKNEAAGRGHKGGQVLHFAQAFHGRTGYALSLTDSHDPQKTRWYPAFDWPRVLNPTKEFPFDDAARVRVEEKEKAAIAAIASAFEANPDDIAAILIEPIQGDGGDNYFRSEFLEKLRQVADAREALLIFDEVLTGFGATGAWFDWQNHGVKPDILVFGKKAQVCGIAATTRLDEVEGVFAVHSRIGSTFSGNLVDMVRCERIIEIIEEENLLDNARTMGTYLLRVLSDIEESHLEVTAVRGRGLFAAFDLPSRGDRDRLVRNCVEEQLLVMPCGERTIGLRPALDIGADAIGRAGAQLEAAIRRAARRK